jgi:hypothetical protein
LGGGFSLVKRKGINLERGKEKKGRKEERVGRKKGRKEG